MRCTVCGSHDLADPFWDDLCDECDHEMNHQGFRDGCGLCIAEAERDYEDGVEPDWVASL